MPRVPTRVRRRGRRLIGGGLLVGAFLLVGCGVPPELRESPPGAATSPSAPATGTPGPSPAPTLSAPLDLPPVFPSPSGYDESIAVPCRSGPSRRQLIALLRRSSDLRVGDRATVRTGPLCSGSWQFTVVRVPGYEPLQVVSEDSTGDLRLVTAGTDVCTIDVRVGAPAGIRALACDAAPPAGAGA